MTIVNFEHKVIFVKTRKVAGTSVEGYLRRLAGPSDVISPIQVPDEFELASQGLCAQNWASSRDIEKRYNELVLQPDFPGARSFKRSIAPDEKLWGPHMNTSRIKRALRNMDYDYDDFFSFTIDRHPYSWVVSYAAFQAVKPSLRGTQREAEVSDLVSEMLMEKFLTNWDVYAPSGKVMVDHVLDFDHLDSEFPTLMKQLGLAEDQVVLPHFKVNASHLDQDLILDAQMKAQIRRRFTAAIDYMGDRWTFED